MPGQQQRLYEAATVRDSRRATTRFNLVSPIGLRRLAEIYSESARACTDDEQWAHLQFSKLLELAMRHINSYVEGDRTEDHLAQAASELFSVMHFEETRPDLNDIKSR